MNARTLAAVSAGFAVMSGIAAANLWRALHAEREVNAVLRAQLAGSTGQTRDLLPASGSDAGTSMPAQNYTNAAPATATPPAGAAAIIHDDSISEQELSKDPGYRKAQLQVNAYATSLAQAGLPLDSSQTRALVKAVLGEQANLKQDILALARTVDLAIPHTQVQAQESLKERQAESGQRVFDAAAPYLTAQQQSAVRSQIVQATAR